MKWITVNSENISELKEVGEFLVANLNQMNTLSLVRWNRVHEHFQCKGSYYFLREGDKYLLIPEVNE